MAPKIRNSEIKSGNVASDVVASFFFVWIRIVDNNEHRIGIWKKILRKTYGAIYEERVWRFISHNKYGIRNCCIKT